MIKDSTQHNTHSMPLSTQVFSSLLLASHQVGGGEGQMENMVGTLVLSRRYGEEIVIGDENTLGGHPVRISVMRGNAGQVRVMIKADKRIPVHRSEVYDRLVQDNAVEQVN